MESEKVENIKIGLECCGINHSCKGCSYDNIGIGCTNKLSENALTLIDELEKENKKLRTKFYKFIEGVKEDCRLEYSRHEQKWFNSYIIREDILNKLIQKLEEE